MVWVLYFSAFATAVEGQDYFSETIPPSVFAVEVADFARLPDASPGSPARASVLTSDPAGRLFVNDQHGPLYLVSDDGALVREYLDLRDYPELGLVSGGDRGVQGFAFHPDFHTAGAPGFGRFYTIHSSNDDSRAPDFSIGGENNLRTVLLEWRTDDPNAVPFAPADGEAPWRELLRLNQPFSNHNAGNIAFDPLSRPGDDTYGALYIALGDSGSGGDPLEAAENPGNPYGAILRIDPLGNNAANGRYGIVAANVLASDGDAGTLGEIYCYGLRNPQRFGWDMVTGALYIADIGQNAVEEINRAVNGGNFGWDAREGSFGYEVSQSPPGVIDPVAEYDHTRPVENMPTGIGNRAVTVGEVARGTRISGLDGHLLFGDFPSGLVFVLDVDADPLEGGQAGLRELVLHVREETGMRAARFLELINSERARRGWSGTSRADLRFSLSAGGRVFLTNKHDGVVRRLVPDQMASLEVVEADDGPALLPIGRLEGSPDLLHWQETSPQPREGTPWTLPDADRFYRVRRTD